MCVDAYRPSPSSVLCVATSLVPERSVSTITAASSSTTTTTITTTTTTTTFSTKNYSNNYSSIFLRRLCQRRRGGQTQGVGWLFLIFLTLLLTPSPVLTLHLYPFNSTNGDSATERTDDGGSGKINLAQPFPFFGKHHDKIFVNNNGAITFFNDLRTYRPENFPLNNTPIIAPYWADVDVLVGGTVWYRQTVDAAILRLAENEVRNYSSAFRKFRANWAFIATWDRVGFYGAINEGRERRNTFQAVLVSDGALSFVILNYDTIEWTTGSNSQGTPETGLGGNPAQVGHQAGFNAGDGVNFYEIEGARTESVINLTRKSNVDIPGKFIFRTDAPEIEGFCSAAGSGTLYFSPSSGSMLGGYEVSITGPCFNTTSEVTGLLVESNSTLPCVIESEAKVRCIMPTDVFLVGQVTVALVVDQRLWNYSGTFTLVNAAQLTLAPQVRRHTPKEWLARKKVNVTWNPSHLPSSEQVLVEVRAFSLEDGQPKLSRVGETLTVANNGGELSMTIPVFDTTALAVIQIKAPHSTINRVPLVHLVRHFPSSMEQRLAVRWLVLWLAGWGEKESELTSLTACPCTLNQAERDLGRWQVDPLCSSASSAAHNCLYRGSNTYECLVPITTGGASSSQVCCYGKDRELLDVREGGGGSMVERYNYRLQGNNTVAWFSYLLEDVVPFLHCCEYGTSRSHCEGFRRVRAPVSCQDYIPPVAAQAAGDPHLVTLDNLSYTFNGEGDFVLLQDISGRIVVHVQASRAQDTEGNTQNATVFTAVAMAVDNETDVVEIRKDQEDFVLVRVNRQEVDITDPRTEFRGITIYKNGTDNDTVELTVVMDTVGISVLVSVTEDLLNIMVLVSSRELQGKLRGLLGNNNNNKSDDFMARNGDIISASSSMREIHFLFGMTWLLNENETLLYHPDTSLLSSSSAPTLRNEFVPVFINSLSNDTYRNGTEELCQGNIQCIYDYQLTGKESIAESTKQFNARFMQVVSEIEPVVRCPYVDQISNGNRTLNGQKVGSIAFFSCDDKYQANGSIALECLASGSWNDSLPTCQRVPLSTDNPALLYAGIIGGVGSFFLLLVTVGLVCLIKRRCTSRKRKPDQTSVGELSVELPVIFTGPDIPNPVFENPHFLSSLQNLRSEGGRFQIPRPRFVDPNIYTEYF
ncbi:sushi domain-containing protein 2-like isoform X2 [Pomacea canaliculata]|uniref:sushi domain-containing protein 2-like isoform X2 n=1 Tax=Pomacea canaliculata TaxID=400727 RepID=UPI000D7351C1|nr:sushi domain-containing protein 2-like isoform X2 [Pomacea canaliculata]